MQMFLRLEVPCSTANTIRFNGSGGIISDYVSGSDVYRVHKFTGSGTFTVTEIGTLGSNVDILSVGGGGSGGSYGNDITGSGDAYKPGAVGSATTTSGFPSPFTAPGGGYGGSYPSNDGGPWWFWRRWRWS